MRQLFAEKAGMGLFVLAILGLLIWGYVIYPHKQSDTLHANRKPEVKCIPNSKITILEYAQKPLVFDACRPEQYFRIRFTDGKYLCEVRKDEDGLFQLGILRRDPFSSQLSK